MRDGTSRYRLHWPGVVYLALLIMVGIASMHNQNNLLFWVFGVMVSGLALSMGLAWVMMRSLRVRRIDPQTAGVTGVGEPLLIRYAITNRSRLFSIFNVHIEERVQGGQATWARLMKPAGAWVMHIGPRETVHGEAIFWPNRRGEAAFDRMRLWTSFPFGIFRRSRTISQPQRVLIHPLLYELKRGVLSSIAPKGLMGMRITQHAGAGDDYFGLREHRPGDSLRHIAWKRTARMDQLIAIERTAPSPARLRVVLDLASPPKREQSENAGVLLEENAISLAASIIHGADLAGFEVGLTVIGFGQQPIAVRRNHWHKRKMMAALAGIDLDSPRQARAQMIEPIRQAERAGLVIITADRAPVGGLASRPDAWYLTGRQLESLTTGRLGWDPMKTSTRRIASEADASPPRHMVTSPVSGVPVAAGAGETWGTA